MLRVLDSTPSLLSQFLAEIRDENIQKDRMRFRRNLERAGEIFAYEISKELHYIDEEVQTPLGIAKVNKISDRLVLGTILRAGLPMHQGLLNYFDQAENAFISAYRKYHKDGAFDIKVEYTSSPSPSGKVLVLTDPMLATGLSMVLAYNALIKMGKPVHTHIVTLIASREGLAYTQAKLPMGDVTIWTAAVDDELTVKSYIVPGLGDAGDLAYGIKE
ncbi:MAG: uracil phosphoribosyltransferase [Bacteroidales bacterium]|nr:uracil phosphoribosyltransferase [Bacteroidales bacterium]MCF8454628.1 uracil phosphoribosyltransferase [Bacteroidales bacterium]